MGKKMERYDVIIKDAAYIKHIKNTEIHEKERIYDRHNLSHFLDVARIGMLINLDENYNIPKDIIYAAAILHDVGRDVQYEEGISHELAALPIARDILSRTDYNSEETEMIITAIKNHRNQEIKNQKDLSGLLYRADKMSRNCFWCNVEETCKWTEDKKNKNIIW